MKTILLILLSTACLAQDLYVKVSDIQTIRIPKGSVYYDTLPKGVGIFYRQLWTDHGLVDTTKQIVVKYETFQIDATTPITETIDSEALTYEGWQRHGTTPDQSWHDGTISYSSTGEAVYTFNGTGIEIYGETGPNHGTGTVSIGTQSKTVSWKSATRTLPAKVTEFKGLPRGNHTVVIKPVSGVILIDFIIIQK